MSTYNKIMNKNILILLRKRGALSLQFPTLLILYILWKCSNRNQIGTYFFFFGISHFDSSDSSQSFFLE